MPWSPKRSAPPAVTGRVVASNWICVTLFGATPATSLPALPLSVPTPLTTLPLASASVSRSQSFFAVTAMLPS